MGLEIVGWTLESQMGPWDSRMGPFRWTFGCPDLCTLHHDFPCTNHRPPFVLGLAGISMHSICVRIGEDVRAHGGLVTVGKTKSQTGKGRSCGRRTDTTTA